MDTEDDKVCKHYFHILELKQSVTNNKVTDQWQPRLRACIRVKGHHSEQLLNRNVAFSCSKISFFGDSNFSYI